MILLLWLSIPIIIFTKTNTIDITTEKSGINNIINSTNIIANNSKTNNSINSTNIVNISKDGSNTFITFDSISNISSNIFSYPFSVDEIFKALTQVYPDIIKPVSKEDNPFHPELAINIRGINFYNVNGRFLPEEERKNWRKYSSNSIYEYSKEIPNPLSRTKKELKELRHQGSKLYRKNKKPTHYRFNEVLYGMTSASDTNYHIVKTRFLNKQVLIHKIAYKPLKKVEKEIYKLTNHPNHAKEINHFLKEGDRVYSFFWRSIAGSKTRSLHSYGVAIDILKEDTTRAIYWLWRQNQKIDWVKEPISVRWNPPLSVVEIFEKYGFVWGGKWNFYDTMHFEYKPEILILNNYKVELLPLEQDKKRESI